MVSRRKKSKLKFIFPKDVPGYISSTEGKLLYELAQVNPRLGKIVELGTFHGRSAICLAQGSQKVRGGKVFTVDNFIGDRLVGLQPDFYPEFIKTIKRYQLKDEVIAWRGETVELAKKWNKPIRLLFLDADHSYQAVELDFNAWGKYIAPSGIIAFHDSLCWLGVYRFVLKLIVSGDFKNFKTLTKDSMGLTTAFRKAKSEKISKVERGKSLLSFVFLSLPKLPVLARVYFSQREETDCWYQFFDRQAKFYRKLERAVRAWLWRR